MTDKQPNMPSSNIETLNPAIKPVLPAKAPLDMPEQVKARQAQNQQQLAHTQHAHQLTLAMVLWRIIMAALTIAITLFFAYELYMVLSINSITPVQIALLILSTISFSLVAFGTATSLCGFAALIMSRPNKLLMQPDQNHKLQSKTALLFPIYNEDPTRIAATIHAVENDIKNLGLTKNFEFFILSDTRDTEKRRQENKIFHALSDGIKQSIPVYFRWRSENYGKKAGNIADWVKNHGADYEHFVIFDADSIMTGDTLHQLARTMEQIPTAGLVQTVPKLVGGKSFIARIQQFAARMYGPLLAKGSAIWHGHDSNYWGHNAIIRSKAFAQSAGLPVLKGNPPFGGTIQSHDFIEAAFLRKAGWGVYLLPEMDGSYEGCPPGITDIIQRDRRWCQGNLQHFKLLPWPKLKLVSRFHLACGIMSYLASIFWLLTISAGLVTAYQWARHEHSYFSDEITLFPNWPVMDAERAYTLMIFTAIIVLTPKLLGLLYSFFFEKAWHRNGLTVNMLVGFLTEIIYSALIAPIFMLAHTGAIISLFLGRDSGWSAQGREDGHLPLSTAFRLYGPYTLAGLILAAACYFFSPELAGWLSLIYVGLILAPILAWTSGIVGRGFFNNSLLTPEDLHPQDVLILCNSYHETLSEQHSTPSQQNKQKPKQQGKLSFLKTVLSTQ